MCIRKAGDSNIPAFALLGMAATLHGTEFDKKSEKVMANRNRYAFIIQDENGKVLFQDHEKSSRALLFIQNLSAGMYRLIHYSSKSILMQTFIKKRS